MAVKQETKFKIHFAIGLAAIFALLVLFVFSGDNLGLLKSIFTHDLSNEELRDKLNDFGWRGYITIAVLSMIQVVCVFLPAEPVQVLSGLTFGFPIGLLCCYVGILLGNITILLLHKTFGEQLRKFFVKKLHLDFEKIAQSSKCMLIIFIMYFLPAVPYGVIAFFAASTNMSYRRFLAITALGVLPSACIGVGLGHMTITSHWIVSVCVFAALLAVLIILMIKREVLFEKLNAFADANKGVPRTNVRKPNGVVFDLFYGVFRAYYFLCGVRIKPVNKVGTPELPAIVLCNHGSFIDFVYAATLTRKFSPNFVVARLYFYDRLLGKLIRTVGGFPKSMFALDLESTKNCVRVLRNNGMLIMMPEARLSTAGRFEDIQKSTFAFLKKSGVPVYTIKFHGDYLADPKWSKGFRRGSVVEAELDLLYTPQDLAQLTANEIQKGVEARLNYDEFAWLQERPQQRYRTSRMAEGVENILAVCPVCGQKHTLTTKRKRIFCQTCGYLTSMDDRYRFTGDFRFENLAQWYDWQKALLEEQIRKNEDFALCSQVELRLPSKGVGLTRSAGQGVCTLSRDGLLYNGTKDGETVQLHFSLERIYRLLFGAGKNFEIYDGAQILFFVPEDKRSCVDWYMASMILYDETVGTSEN